eukprot:g678.t1
MRHYISALLAGSVLTEADLGRFLWLSDFHFDAYYNKSLGSKCRCNQLKHRLKTLIPDGECLQSVQPFGQPDCDAPWALEESAMKAAAAALPKPDFIVITGDYTRHFTDEFGTSANQEVWRAINSMVNLTERHFMDAPVFHLPQETFGLVMGNDDFVPNYGRPSPSFIANVTTAFTTAGPWHVAGMAEGGFSSYSIPLKGVQLTIISLNTVLYAPSRSSAGTEADPFGQFTWLEQSLAKLSGKSRKNRVYICGHIPPAFDSYSLELQWLPQYIETYFGIIKKYRQLIVAQLFGHTHKDEFRVHSDPGIPPLYIVGAITPIYGNNPIITIAVLAFVAVGGVVIYQRQQRRQQQLQQQQRQGAAGGRDRYSFRKDDASEYEEGGDGTSYVRMSDISHTGRYGDNL